ncbi:growth/differentiation factor 10-like [Entelurus aequoreus]|nr:growth/differentiation factor 10-like [Entelurus aequoreus]
METFPSTSAMAKWFMHTLHVLMLLQSTWSKMSVDVRGAAVRPSGHSAPEQRVFTHATMATVSMLQVYERYSKDPRSHNEGNTVRSFTAVPKASHGKEMLQFNLSSIQNSEVILSASFHFFYTRQCHRLWRSRRRHPLVLFHELLSNNLLGNATLSSFKKGAWQSVDVTSVVQQGKDRVIMVESDFILAGMRQRSPNDHERLSSDIMPFLILYADDQAINEPNSVAATLQRYKPLRVEEDATASSSRIRRELHHQIQTNDIPEVQFGTLKNHKLWQSTFFPGKSKAKAGRKQHQEDREALGKQQVLSFDERTMKKARRRQWSEPRVCSRRYLRVDFADIGWSEWVLAPKSFDAYYCAGSCGFPIPKVVRPSNHATIQSIVKAVGIVPGIPEPCCVPEKMSPLSVLFLDPTRNMVLKVYPGMSVDTCACR